VNPGLGAGLSRAMSWYRMATDATPSSSSSETIRIGWPGWIRGCPVGFAREGFELFA